MKNIGSLAVFLLIGCLCLQAAEHYVAPGGNDVNSGASWSQAWQTISNGVALAAEGDTLILSNGLYELAKQVTLDKGLTITNCCGAPEQVVVSGMGTVRCFLLNHADALLDGITISNGYAFNAAPNPQYGGGAHVISGRLRNCIIRNNNAAGTIDTTGYGGGVSLLNGEIANSTVMGNLAGGYSGMGGVGGGIYLGSNAAAFNCAVTGNLARYWGGGIYIAGGSGTVTSCRVTFNECPGNGAGGIYASDGAGVFNTTCAWNNTSAKGGGIYAMACVMSNCLVTGNTSTYASTGGGGIYMDSGACIFNSEVSGNVASNGGGGIYALGVTGLVQACVLSGNKAKNGGGIYHYASQGPLTIKNCTIHSNTASTSGGGIGNAVSFGRCVVEDCLINSNQASTGAGFYSSSDNHLVAECRFIGNSSVTYGGALRLATTAATLTSSMVRNCLFTGNHCDGDGGAVYLIWGRFDNCTVISNTANRTGGFWFDNSSGRTSILNNCILYWNDGGSYGNYRASTTGTAEFNHCCTTPALPADGYVFRNTIAYEPGLDLQAIRLYRLLPDSPCRNTGANQMDWMAAGIDLDRRTRIDRFSRLVDMGCYEYLPQGMMFSIY